MNLEQHFGLDSSPFPKAATPASLFKGPALETVLDRLHFALARQSTAVVVAESGCGKSTALFSFAQSLDAATYYVLSTSLTTLAPFSFIAHLLASMGLPARRFKGEASVAFLRHLRSQPKHTVLLIDEAHLLPDSCLEDLRLLSADNLDRSSPFSLVLVGQPILRQRLAEPQHYALWQRIGVKVRLRPLNENELPLFLDSHIRAAGCQQNLFEPPTLSEIFHHSRGIPRLIQNIALEAMLAAMHAGKQTVDLASVEHALVDFDAL